MVREIAVLSITLLLGSSAVIGGQLPCHEIQKITRQMYSFDMGKVSPIEYSNFDNPLDFGYGRSEKYAKSEDDVTQSGQSVPQITVGGKSYKLYAITFRLIDFNQGVANLLVLFSANGHCTPDQTVALFIPLSISEDGADVNKQLNSDLSAFSKLSRTGNHNVASVQWLKPLMEKAILVNRLADRPLPSGSSFQMDTGEYSLPDVSYLTDCVMVSKDTIKAYT